MTGELDVQTLPFEADDGLGNRARIGLIVLQTDQTVEHDLATVLRADGVVLYHTRIPNATEVTTTSLQQMAQDLPSAAALLPLRFQFDALAYCCTSGATLIGEDKVEQILRTAHPGARATNPLTACKDALHALDATRIALVTPYAPSVTARMRENFKTAGFDINAIASFNQSDDFAVARISPQSILHAVERIGASDECDAVMVSCTSLRTLPIIALAEAQLDKPVISSNQALAWHLMQLTGLESQRNQIGRLFQCTSRNRV